MLGFVYTYHVFIVTAIVLESTGLWLKAWVLEPDWFVSWHPHLPTASFGASYFISTGLSFPSETWVWWGLLPHGPARMINGGAPVRCLEQGPAMLTGTASSVPASQRPVTHPGSPTPGHPPRLRGCMCECSSGFSSQHVVLSTFFQSHKIFSSHKIQNTPLRHNTDMHSTSRQVGWEHRAGHPQPGAGQSWSPSFLPLGAPHPFTTLHM